MTRLLRMMARTRHPHRSIAPLALALLFTLFEVGCTSLAYVTQAAVGQADLNDRARDIDELVRDKRLEPRKRRLLEQIAQMKKFGELHGLRATSNYTKYVRLDTRAVVWVVSASDPLRFQSRSWSFPFVGNFTYLGWFKLDDAKRFADRLRTENLDVNVRPAGAYSTTGFFEDSVLSSMIGDGPEALGDLANTILHESAHSTFFARHQSTLNESVANFVGNKLGQLYLESTLGADAPETIAYLSAMREAVKRGEVMQSAYNELDALYKSGKSRTDKLAQKNAILKRLRAKLGFRPSKILNNATIIQFRTYNSGQSDFESLLQACGNDWQRFIAVLKRLEQSRFPAAQIEDVGSLLEPLIRAQCT